MVFMNDLYYTCIITTVIKYKRQEATKLGVQKQTIGEGKGIKIESPSLKVKILPDLGAKMTELIWKKSGHNFFYTDTEKLNSAPYPDLNSDYEPPFASGFDECFPTITKLSYHLNGETIELADHGELWSGPWEYELGTNSVELVKKGLNLEYEFKKRITLDGVTVHIDYEVKNTGIKTFQYLWSSHPLFVIEEGDEIVLPEEVDVVDVYWGNSNLNIDSKVLNWPNAGLKKIPNLSVIASKGTGAALKLFTKRLRTGLVKLKRNKIGKEISIEFDTEKTPFLGIWMCFGGWPLEGSYRSYVVGLEPTTSNKDSLNEAIEQKTAVQLLPGESRSWSLKLLVQES